MLQFEFVQQFLRFSLNLCFVRGVWGAGAGACARDVDACGDVVCGGRGS